jgi:Na+/phosphate symporter
MKRFLVWLKVFAAAVLGAGAGAALQAVAAGSTDPKAIKAAALSGAVLTVAGYLKASPIGAGTTGNAP